VEYASDHFVSINCVWSAMM